ncbi:MAG: cyclic nucleotide-binding domain-containing protein [Chloroflexi bacterium]|nr:cyclic nucleotide-binding domain-containing protein [Chloroflexota bacterium]
MNKDFLRRSELFAGLPDADLDWLLEQADSFSLAAGEVLLEEGMPGDAAFIVIDGELEVKKKSDTQNILIAIRAPGEVIGEMALLDHAPRMATVRAVRPSRLLKIRGDTFQQLLSQKPSAALAILHTVSKRLRQNEAILRQSEKMAALGTLTAGLAHELNNPVAAVRRSVDQLRSALAGWAKTSIDLDRCTLTAKQISVINDLKIAIEARPAPDLEPDPLLQSDREASLQSWLETIGLEDAWELSPTLVSCSWELDSLQKLEASFDLETLPLVVKWLAAGCAVYSLLDETRMASERVSEIVRSVKAYSYLDQAPIQEVDVHEGLENTLVILRHKTKEGVKIKREYDTSLPHIEAHGSELNQVWTNIIDNAIDAMDGKGELTLRTYPNDGKIVVEIEDAGCGIPTEIQDRIFEPFYTTKPPGKGTGLGLHIAYTIINNHYGQINVTSKPGMTRFQVALPVQLPR